MGKRCKTYTKCIDGDSLSKDGFILTYLLSFGCFTLRTKNNHLKHLIRIHLLILEVKTNYLNDCINMT